MSLNQANILQELTDNTSKFLKGMEILQEIKEVDIASTPKTEVYREDKLTLYRYNSQYNRGNS